MSKLEEYLDEMTDHIVGKVNGLDIDLGGHAKGRNQERNLSDNNALFQIAKKIAEKFNKDSVDGLFGFYAKNDHISGIFRYFKNRKAIKFITIFPEKSVVFMNDIQGCVIFNEEENKEIQRIDGIYFNDIIIL